ncbi:MAG: PaaX family transcriptional regulator C-terminal domain-containing protein [Pseudomonadota bacterium]
MRSLIVTLWGDALLPYDGSVWMGCVPQLLMPLGFEEKAIRMAIQRLVSEGWLISEKDGRRRNLSMSDAHRPETQRVQARVYTDAVPGWDGVWLLVRVEPETAAERELVRRTLQQRGFGHFSPGLFIHPQVAPNDLLQSPDMVCFTSSITAVFQARELTNTAKLTEIWNIEALAAWWGDIERLAIMAQNVETPQDAFFSRVLLVHEVRRLVLAYPSLPLQHLPEDWPEDRVRRVFRDVYWQLFSRSQRFLDEKLVLSGGTRPHWHGFDPHRFGREDHPG